jgi:hypothetical protein
VTGQQVERMSRVKVWLIVGVALGVAGGAGWRLYRTRVSPETIVVHAKGRSPNDRLRQSLFAELQPVALTNCDIKRFGEVNDGGYLLCGNLLNDVQSGYSYGISGYDGWGCQVSRERKIKVHEYDCFNLTEPRCPGGATIFHAECVAGKRSTDEAGRLFDSLENQIAKNGDAGRHLLVKMDVEGAEWETFVNTPDAVLGQIDQLAVEFHGANRQRFLDVVTRLKRIFYIANVHFNNYSCSTELPPFPAWAYEVLLVNKRLGIPDGSGRHPAPSAPTAPNNPQVEDCQGLP